MEEQTICRCKICGIYFDEEKGVPVFVVEDDDPIDCEWSLCDDCYEEDDK